MYNNNIGVACAYLDGIYFSTNLNSLSGAIWTFIPANTLSIITTAYITYYSISAEIYGSTNDGSIIYSNNSGLSWLILYTLQNIFLSNIYFSSRLYGVICGYTNSILITTNGGYTFRNVYPGFNAYYYQTLIGKSYYIIEGTLYGVNEQAIYEGMEILRKATSPAITQSDVDSDSGYLPIKWTENTTKELWVKPLYVAIPAIVTNPKVNPLFFAVAISDKPIKLSAPGLYTGIITNPLVS
jgi:hypothetical protein